MDNNYSYNVGFLNIKKSRVLPNSYTPKDDILRWLHIEVRGIKYTLIYEIIDVNQAKYDGFFEVRIDFFRFDILKELLEPNKHYNVYRGEEKIGIVKLINKLLEGKKSIQLY